MATEREIFIPNYFILLLPLKCHILEFEMKKKSSFFLFFECLHIMRSGFLWVISNFLSFLRLWQFQFFSLSSQILFLFRGLCVTSSDTKKKLREKEKRNKLGVFGMNFGALWFLMSLNYKTVKSHNLVKKPNPSLSCVFNIIKTLTFHNQKLTVRMVL